MLNRFRLTFRLAVVGGTVSVKQGTPPPRFVAAVADVARLHQIDRGEIECLGAGKYARLRFSRDFPNRGRQAIRNVWTPPTTPGPAGGTRAHG